MKRLHKKLGERLTPRCVKIDRDVPEEFVVRVGYFPSVNQVSKWESRQRFECCSYEQEDREHFTPTIYQAPSMSV